MLVGNNYFIVGEIMLLNQLPIRSKYSSHTEVKPGNYYAASKNDEPVLIFKCVASNSTEVISDNSMYPSHGQYQAYVIENSDIQKILKLQKKCSDDHYRWINRNGIGNHSVIDLSVLATKFNVK